MKDISFKAMLAGATAGMAFSLMGSVLFAGFAAVSFRLAGESASSFNERMAVWPTYLISVLAIGGLGDAFAGFIGGLVGRAAPTKNGVAAAVCGLVLMLPMVPAMLEMQPLWSTVVSFLLVVPCAWLGARAAMALAPKKKATTAQ